MKRYFIRAAKFALYLCIILMIMLVVIYTVNTNVLPSDAKFSRLFANGGIIWMLVIVAFFGAMYPMYGFVTIKIPFSKPLDDKDRETIINLFETRKYTLVDNNMQTLAFRPKSTFNRLTRMFEDRLEVNYSNAIVQFSGMRKDVYRFKRAIETIAFEGYDKQKNQNSASQN